MIRGETRNIAQQPVIYKNLDELAAFTPLQIAMHNSKVDDAGNWLRRPGYASKWDVGIDRPIDLLIPEGVGYAVTDNGRIFKLSSTPARLTGRNLNGTYRPTWAYHNDIIIICDGGNPVKISGGNTALLGGSPPKGKFVDHINAYTIMAGYNDVNWKNSATGNPENWTSGNSAERSVKQDGQKIRYMTVHDEKIFFLLARRAEWWWYRGVTGSLFGRQDGLGFDVGCGADDSVVKANSTVYWYGHDDNFYQLVGNRPRVISQNIDAELKGLQNPQEIYGFDFSKEHLIRWFAPSDGRCFVFDYGKDRNYFIQEDNYWDGQWERMRINSYMELNGEQYFGDYNLTGLIYHWSTDYKNDNGQPIRNYREFAVRLSQNGNNGKVNKIQFELQRGVATASITSPKMLFSYRFDRGTWSNETEIDLGAKGDADPIQDFYSLGIGRRMDLRLTQTDAVESLLLAVRLTVEPLGN